MSIYKKRQEKGFQELKTILEKKETSTATQKCIERLEELFSLYIIMDLDWGKVLRNSQELNGNDLEEFLLQVVEFAEAYDEQSLA